MEKDCPRGKTRYRSAGEAERAMKRMATRHNAKQRNGLKPYKCEHCDTWHLGRLTPISGNRVRQEKVRRSRELARNQSGYGQSSVQW